MKYEKPKLVAVESAITAIQAGMSKVDDIQDSKDTLSPAAYQSDE